MITVSQLSKRFGRLRAVDNLSFDVPEGEAVALWGANGAGKTTVIRCLLNLTPFEGEVTIAGMNMQKQGKVVRRLIGFVPQELSFHDDLTVAETLTFYARLKKLPSGFDFTPRLTQLGLSAHLQQTVGNLSGGLKQRLALALALLSDPPILILDEPTASLDIRAREDFLELLHNLKVMGKTMLFSSHRQEEVTAVADRVLLLEAGKLVVDAPPSDLEKQLGWETTLHVYLPIPQIPSAMQALVNHPFPVSPNGRGIRVQAKPGEKATVLRLLYDADIPVDDFTLE